MQSIELVFYFCLFFSNTQINKKTFRHARNSSIQKNHKTYDISYITYHGETIFVFFGILFFDFRHPMRWQFFLGAHRLTVYAPRFFRFLTKTCVCIYACMYVCMYKKCVTLLSISQPRA